MDERAAKLALARKKLKDHQEKKQECTSHKDPRNPNNLIHFDNEHHNNMCGTESVASLSEENTNNANETTLEFKPPDNVSHYHASHSDVNATEILISNKRNLELQLNSLQAKMMELENQLATSIKKYEDSCQKINVLENDLRCVNHDYQAATEQLALKDMANKELSDLKTYLLEEKSNLQEQLEFAKSVLTAKEAENGSLHSQLFNIQSQLDATQLQLQQLTSGTHSQVSDNTTETLIHDNEVLKQKVSTLEHQLKIQVKDYQQLNAHYENYVGEINEQLKSVMRKNEELLSEVQHLSNRENSLIEQISDMEIRLQNYNSRSNEVTQQHAVSTEINEMKENYNKAQESLQDLSSKYEELQRLYAESRTKVEELTQSKELESVRSNESVSLLKLNADITSDKIAAQRATEQNKKLKQDIQGLEDAFVKMTKDKLELTEKLTAEKFLNRELTIKLAEVDEKASDMQNKLKAKDEEMIRLQTSCRALEAKYNQVADNMRHMTENTDHQNLTLNNETKENCTNGKENDGVTHSHEHESCDHKEHSELMQNINVINTPIIPKDDAMKKLQERFLKIMGDVADLSDEKHRLEHIITQLQNETDTICEYVALYQQQRSLLKKRDEERSAQIKLFQSECTRLQSQLDELTGILKRFAEDKELSSYFQTQTKHEDIVKVMSLLSNLKNNSLIDPQKTIGLNDFYPCSCCSGQLIEV